MRVGDRIYCDHAATTPLSVGAREAMQPWLGEAFHNPSSLYDGARVARRAIDEARESVAAAAGVLPAELLFTSSGTEAVNLAIIGTALANENPRRTRYLFSAVEHSSVLETESVLKRLGYGVDLIPVDQDGRVSEARLMDLLSDDVLLVAAMHANNETGSLNDIASIARTCRTFGTKLLCDAVQTFGFLPLPGDPHCPDLVAISAHKLYGPKGVGALILRAGVQCKPVLVGGGQEREMRAGTENVAGIVGFASAVQEAVQDVDRFRRVATVRERFRERLHANLELKVEFSVSDLPGHAHFRVVGASAEAMLINLDRLGVDASSGAACSSGSIEPSHVLIAMGWEPQATKEALRFTFGAHSRLSDADEAAERVGRAAAMVLSKVG